MNLLFVSFDNSSTLTISDLSLFHSFSHQIYPQNGLNLSLLLPLCSSTLAFAVREVDIVAFLMLTIQVKVLLLGPKDFYVKNGIFIKDFIQYLKCGTFSTAPNISKLIIKSKASFQSLQNQLKIG